MPKRAKKSQKVWNTQLSDGIAIFRATYDVNLAGALMVIFQELGLPSNTLFLKNFFMVILLQKRFKFTKQQMVYTTHCFKTELTVLVDFLDIYFGMYKMPQKSVGRIGW